MDYKYIIPAVVVLVLGGVGAWLAWPAPAAENVSKLTAMGEELAAFQERTMRLEREMTSLKRQIATLEEQVAKAPRVADIPEEPAVEVEEPVDEAMAEPVEKPVEKLATSSPSSWAEPVEGSPAKGGKRQGKAQAKAEQMAAQIGLNASQSALLSDQFSGENAAIAQLRRKHRRKGDFKKTLNEVKSLRAETDNKVAGLLDEQQYALYQEQRTSEFKKIKRKMKKDGAREAPKKRASVRKKKTNKKQKLKSGSKRAQKKRNK